MKNFSKLFEASQSLRKEIDREAELAQQRIDQRNQACSAFCMQANTDRDPASARRAAAGEGGAAARGHTRQLDERFVGVRGLSVCHAVQRADPRC